MDEDSNLERKDPNQENADAILNRILSKSGFVLRSDRPAEPETHRAPESVSEPVIEQKVFFKNVQFLKSGGMANLYLAVLNDPQSRWHDRKIVIKRIIPDQKDNDNYRDLFFKEYLLLRDLDHENIVRIIEQGEDETGQYYLCEFINGKNLNDLIEPGVGLTKKDGKRKRLLDILMGILNGIQGIHEAGIIHRDIKPENILITNSTNKVKIIDFGLAKTDAVDDKLREVGTVPYASLEQLYNAYNVDNRTDIYSFGIILLELITGSNDKSICKGLNNLFPNLVEVINKCTEEQVDQRYRYISEIVDDLSKSEVQNELNVCKEKTIVEINKVSKLRKEQKSEKKKDEGDLTGEQKSNKSLVYFLIIGLFAIIIAVFLFKFIPLKSKLEMDSVEFTNKAGEIKTLDINFPGNWHIQSTMDWVEVNKTDEINNQIIIKTLSDNTTFNEKVGKLKIVDDKNEVIKSLDIKQLGLLPQLTATPNKITFDNSINQPYIININSNLSWSVKSDKDWINIDQNSGNKEQQISVSAKYPNLNDEPREGKVILKAFEIDKTETIQVIQTGQMMIEFDRPFISFDITSLENDKIKVSSNTDWKFGEIPSFLKVDPLNGPPGNTEVNISLLKDNVDMNKITVNILSTKTNSIINSLTIDFNGQKKWSYNDLNNYMNKIRNTTEPINYDELYIYVDPKCQVYFFINNKKMTSAEDLKTFINRIKFGATDNIVENSLIYNSEGKITEFCQE